MALLVDRALLSGIRFVLDKVAKAVDNELNDEERLREELLAGQMQVETGELAPEAFAPRERAILQRLREIREEREGLQPGAEGVRISGAVAELTGDEHEATELETLAQELVPAAPKPKPGRRTRPRPKTRGRRRK